MAKFRRALAAASLLVSTAVVGPVLSDNARAALEPDNNQVFSQDGPVRGGSEFGDIFGQAVATGDFNNDGFDDLLVGAEGEAVGAANNAGVAHVLYGSLSGVTTVGNVMLAQSGPLPGSSEAGDRFGAALAVGDFNGDGFDDAAIGAPGEGIGSLSSAGLVHILYGSSGGLQDTGSEYITQSGPIPGSNEANDLFGGALAAGDFDNDGFDDLVVGAPGEALGAITNAGAVVVVPGTAAGLDPTASKLLSQAAPLAGSPETGDRFGWVLAVGNFDDDLFDDLAIGVPHEDLGSVVDAGMVHVVPGSGSGVDSSAAVWFSQAGSIVGNVETGDLFGWALAAGDFDTDGADDLALGAPGEDIGSLVDAGVIAVLYGATGQGIGASRNQAFSQSGSVAGVAESNDLFGAALTTGDFDQNGAVDLAVGTHGETVQGKVAAGGLTVLYGQTALGITSVDSREFSQLGSVAGVPEVADRFAWALAAGDFNNDGNQDVAVGAPGEDNSKGAVHVLFGQEAASGITTSMSNGQAYQPDVSADSSQVVFTADGPNTVTNLATADTFGLPDVFLRDVSSGSTTLISIGLNGELANDASFNADINDDGTLVVFDSSASNLVAGDVHGFSNIFLRNIGAATTERISVGLNGAQPNGNSTAATVSANGRYVAFSSLASNLVVNDTNNASDVFVYDRVTTVTTRVSVRFNGAQGNGPSSQAVISDDGSTIVFASVAPNLIANDSNGRMDIFVVDRVALVPERVSVDSQGVQSGLGSYAPTISDNGQVVAFVSPSANLAPGDTNLVPDVFVHDRSNATTVRVSVASQGGEGNDVSSRPSLSGSGRYVAFESYASNLVSADNNNDADVFVNDRTANTTQLVSTSTDRVRSNGYSGEPAMADGGLSLVFTSAGTNLVPGDTNGSTDIFLHVV